MGIHDGGDSRWRRFTMAAIHDGGDSRRRPFRTATIHDGDHSRRRPFTTAAAEYEFSRGTSSIGSGVMAAQPCGRCINSPSVTRLTTSFNKQQWSAMAVHAKSICTVASAAAIYIISYNRLNMDLELSAMT